MSGPCYVTGNGPCVSPECASGRSPCLQRSAARDCRSCRHVALALDRAPCTTCEHGNGARANWTPTLVDLNLLRSSGALIAPPTPRRSLWARLVSCL